MDVLNAPCALSGVGLAGVGAVLYRPSLHQARGPRRVALSQWSVRWRECGQSPARAILNRPGHEFAH
jgi:hypothetical protein